MNSLNFTENVYNRLGLYHV